MRHALAWVEVALAVMLLVGAGLFISSFVRLLRIDHGFDARGLVAIDYASQRVPEGQARDLTYLPRMLAAVREVPGIEAALVTAGNGPFFGGYSTVPLRVVGRATPPSDSLPGLRIKRASTGFLEILRVPILRGRSFTTADSPNAVPAVIINHAAARQFWPGENPLGQRLEIEKLQWEIVGIAADMRYSDPTAPPVPEAFLHYEQSATHGGGTLLLRAAGDPLSLVPAVKAAVWAVNPAQALTAIQTVEDQFDRTTAARRFNMLLMSIFAALALVIAGTGIFGVIAFLVGRRTREIGVRISLGAQRSQVLALFLRQGIVVVGTGIAAGLCGSWMLARTIEKFLFEVQPRDPVVFAAVAVTLGTIGIAASWLPARRAARIDPVIALRHE